MTSFFQHWLVKYRCSCSAWLPISQLYFCRKCAQLKCPICLNEEIDIIFCPNCLEKHSNTEAQQKRFRCSSCHECPICRNLLSIRSQADLYYSQCNACQWKSRNMGVMDRAGPTDQWPDPENPIEGELNKVMTIMKGQSNRERFEREMFRRSCLSNFDRSIERETSNKRISNLGILHSDRFNLQNSYNLRKKALQQNTEVDEKLELLAPSSDVPELDPDIFTVAPLPEKTLELGQLIAHPVTEASTHTQLIPSKVKMVSRRALRCLVCETMLYKGELSPHVVKPRLQNFALNQIPEIRISRPIQLIPGQSSAVFLTVTNNTANPMNISLSGQGITDDASCVNCSNFSMQFVLPNRVEDGQANQRVTIDPHKMTVSDPNEVNSRVLYISQHRAGICLECIPSENASSHYALLRLSFCLQPDNLALEIEVRVWLAGDEREPFNKCT